MIDNNVIRMAVLKTFHDNAKDTIDVYCEVILNSVGEQQENSKSIPDIKKLVENKFQLTIPHDFIKTVLKRLRKNNLIHYTTLKNLADVRVTNEGEKEITQINVFYEEAKRERNNVIDKLRSYFPGINDIKIEKYLVSFIQNNPLLATSSLLKENENNIAVLDDKNSNKIKDFFIAAQDKEPECFKYLAKIVYGEIVSSNLLKNNNFSIKNVSFYIDTNVFLSLLGLHDDGINESANEFINIVKKNNGELIIFERTKNEIIAYLNSFIWNEHKYTPSIPVQSLHYNMKEKGYDSQNTFKLISNLDDEISKRGIKISYEKHEIKIDKKYYRLFIDKKKDKEKSVKAIDHDCYLIESIRKIRQSSKDSCFYIHSSKAILVSLDKILVNFTKNNHLVTIPEAFMPAEITGILWLNGPQNNDNNQFFSNFLAVSVTKTKVQDNTWNSFIYQLERLKKAGNITEKDISLLLMNKNTNQILLGSNKNKIKKLFSDENINKLRRDNKERDVSITDQKQEIINLRNKENQTNKEWIDRFINIGENIKNNAKKSDDKKTKYTKILIKCVLIVCLLIFFCLIFYLFPFQEDMFYWNEVFGFFFVIIDKKSFLYKKIASVIDAGRDKRIQKIINDKKKEINFTELF